MEQDADAGQRLGPLISNQCSYVKQKRRNSSMSCSLSWNYLEALATLLTHGHSDNCHRLLPLLCHPRPQTDKAVEGIRHHSSLLADRQCSLGHFLPLLQRFPRHVPVPTTTYTQEKSDHGKGACSGWHRTAPGLSRWERSWCAVTHPKG